MTHPASGDGDVYWIHRFPLRQLSKSVSIQMASFFEVYKSQILAFQKQRCSCNVNFQKKGLASRCGFLFKSCLKLLSYDVQCTQFIYSHSCLSSHKPIIIWAHPLIMVLFAYVLNLCPVGQHIKSCCLWGLRPGKAHYLACSATKTR